MATVTKRKGDDQVDGDQPPCKQCGKPITDSRLVYGDGVCRRCDRAKRRKAMARYQADNQQQCPRCGRQFYSPDAGACAERKLPLKKCGEVGCDELIGEDLEFCMEHQPPLPANATRIPRKRRPGEPWGITVPTPIEPHVIDIPGWPPSAWIEAGQLDDGRWVWGCSTGGKEPEPLVIRCAVREDDPTAVCTSREQAFLRAASALRYWAIHRPWPAEAIDAIHEVELNWATSPGRKLDRATKAGRHLSTATPAGIAAVEPPPVPRATNEAKLAFEWELAIDGEFQAAQRPLTPCEFDALETSLIEEGCRDPVVAWENGPPSVGFIVIDGHNRFGICQRRALPFRVVFRSFPDRAAVLDWIKNNQLGRRNLTPAERDELLARDYRRELEARKNGRAHDEPQGKAAVKVAAANGVSPATVKRAVQWERSKERIARLTHMSLPELSPLKRGEVAELEALSDDDLREQLAGGIDAWRLGKELVDLTRPDATSKAHAAAKSPSKRKAKRARRLPKERDLRKEAEGHIARYLDTLEGDDAWQQSEYLLDALNQWRGRNRPKVKAKQSKQSTNRPRRKPR